MFKLTLQSWLRTISFRFEHFKRRYKEINFQKYFYSNKIFRGTKYYWLILTNNILFTCFEDSWCPTVYVKCVETGPSTFGNKYAFKWIGSERTGCAVGLSQPLREIVPGFIRFYNNFSRLRILIDGKKRKRYCALPNERR